MGGPIKQAIYDLVRKRPGLDRNAITALVYADHPDGGPENSNVISVHVNAINKRLKPQGLRIHSRRWHGYRVEAI